MKKTKLFFLIAGMFALSSARAQQTYVDGDVLLVTAPMMSHDSTQCMSMNNLVYNITKQNSFTGDSMLVVDMFSQQLMNTYYNTTGQNPWTLSVPGILYNPFVTDDQLMGNQIMFQGPDVKVISGYDTVVMISNFFFLTVNDPCEYGTVTGKVYVDNNNDCVFNTGDLELAPIPVQGVATLNNTFGTMGTTGYTNTNGDYDITIQKSWMTSYTVSLPSAYQFIFPSTTCTPLVYNLSTLSQSGKDFALQCSSDIDVQCSATPSASVRPTIPFYIFPSVSNTGCDSASGTLSFVLDPDVVYDPNQTIPAPDMVNGDTLVWNYNGLTNLTNGGYWNSFTAAVHLTPNTNLNIGDSACFRVFTNLPNNDVNLANNDQSFCLPVVNSYDPNMKEVTPKGEGSIGAIPPTTSRLTYTVHFQNTGNAPAFNVSIVDTLDGDIDESSLTIMNVTHNMTPEWIAPGVVKFNFYNIMLADSNSNEPASHGSVQYSVKLNSGLAIGTQIKNTARIFFDSNPAIVTNTTLNTIAWPVAVSNINGTQGDINVYPNPASDNIYIESKDLKNGMVSISDISGKTIISAEINSDKVKVNVSKLPAGVYFLKVTGDSHSSVRKFVKQ